MEVIGQKKMELIMNIETVDFPSLELLKEPRKMFETKQFFYQRPYFSQVQKEQTRTPKTSKQINQ